MFSLFFFLVINYSAPSRKHFLPVTISIAVGRHHNKAEAGKRAEQASEPKKEILKSPKSMAERGKVV